MSICEIYKTNVMSVCLTYPIENGRVSFVKSVIKIFGMKDLTINKIFIVDLKHSFFQNP